MAAYFLLLIPAILCASEPDFRPGASVPLEGRANPYELSGEEFLAAQKSGKIHAQIYPVEVTGLLPPIAPLRKVLEGQEKNIFNAIAQFFFRELSGIHSLNDLLGWMGLPKYPKASDQGVYSVPFPDGIRPQTKMGFGLIHTADGEGFTVSCAACHSSQLFGKTVLGLSNRFPRSNETFWLAKKILPHISARFFRAETGASEGEVKMFERTKENLRSIGVKKPLALGLDTSLAQVALSLARRNQDAWASKNESWQKHPRPEPLKEYAADSKPAVWWNVKYKNRWLSDGSVLSGNPIYTNILWNEIGRGADLQEIQSWLLQNQPKIQELTTAVFSSEAPRITDFFPAEKISLDRAKRGEKIFQVRCAGCHGNYEKAWSKPNSRDLPLAAQLETIRVSYHEKTPVINVGTDPQRRLGMKSLEQLNDLEISKNSGILVQAQNGYVPPPLVGIWARWPYLHNNSVPNLCALLTAGKDRPKSFWMGPARKKEDFDFACNGYPKVAPRAWSRSPEFYYRTRRAGLSNQGHDEGIFLRQGQEILSWEEKLDLIQFLQTL